MLREPSTSSSGAALDRVETRELRPRRGVIRNIVAIEGVFPLEMGNHTTDEECSISLRVFIPFLLAFM